jgi:hypothetical protein
LTICSIGTPDLIGGQITLIGDCNAVSATAFTTTCPGQFGSYIGGSVSTTNNVSVNTVVSITVAYTNEGTPCNSSTWNTVSLYGTILAGTNYAYIDPCTVGYAVGYIASICNVCIFAVSGDPTVNLNGSCQKC